MSNLDIAKLFHEIADLLEIKDDNAFKIRAYRRAAMNLESLTEEIEAVAARGGLAEIAGIGKDLAAKIQQAIETGRMAYLEELRAEIPRGVVELMAIPGVGPKTAKLLFQQLQVDSVERLEALALQGKLLGLPGVKQKTVDNILKGIQVVKAGRERMPLGRALPLARELVQILGTLPDVRQISLAGSLRRMRETVKDIDLLVTSTRPSTVMAVFTTLPQVAEVLLQGETKATIRHREGIQVDLRVVEPDCFGAALQYFTGSKAHNIRVRELAVRKGLKVSEYGVFKEATGTRIAGATEEEVYKAIGLPYIPPELREDAGEVEAALEGRLPELLTLADLRGDLHAHTNWTDGHHPLEALIEAAQRRGYEYIVVSDHSRAATVAGGLSEEKLLEQISRIRALSKKYTKIRILAGSECDILADGNLDLSDRVLAQLDIVVCAIHSRFKQDRAGMTARIVKALANPYVHIFAHPTGRLIGERDPYDVDMEAVFAAAKQYGKALEINAQPSRLDLNDHHARRAKELGVKLAISTDTHVLDQLDNMSLGVATARRGWIEKSDVINTMPLDRLLTWTHKSRPRAV
ncbi:DNA polymerase/3'-5' exonuclease PolX [Candidatus Methylomirabilis sp.]|uniref:DNA polymerase/3'-5' exonuclease PolX n=1 Tax=Candidatus Methylomirabilis sp. TaxID=2032687 RepID=UPI0030760890